MLATKRSWQIWTRLLVVPAATTVLLLICFSGLRGYALPAPESIPQNVLLEATAKPPPPAPMQVAASVTISVCETDVVLVLDRSGSMELDTVGYGCWEVDEGEGYDYTAWPSGEAYPDGVRHPLPYPSPLCSGYDPEDMYYTYEGNEYIIIEAEHYTTNWPPFNPNYQLNKTSYWGLQRNGRGSSAVGDDPGRCDGVSGARAGCGGYMQHNPFAVMYPEQVYDSSELADAPQLTYEFVVPVSSIYRLWLRGQGGANGWSADVDQRTIHWGLNGTYEGTSTNFQTGGIYEGARYDDWRWRQVDEFNLTAGVTHTLQIFAGGAGFRLDKIVLTNGPNSEADDILPNSGGLEGRKGPDATAGRSGYACWPCHPYYGLPTSPECQAVWDANPMWQQAYDATFDDKQHIRALKEAAKDFIEQVDVAHHQVGLVSYSSRASTDNELECLWRGNTCVSLDMVADAIEELDPSDATNIGEALLFAINVLEWGPGHYGRPGVNKVIILVTDGMPNDNTGVSGCGDPYPHDGGSGTAHDCAVHMAEVARDNGITIHTIGLGEGADEVLLEWIADLTGGTHFSAPSKEDMDGIMDQLTQQALYGCSLTLGISKSVTPTVGVSGEPFTFTLAVSGTGAVSTTWVLIQDTLPEGTTFITASGLFSPASPAAGDTLTWDIGTLPYDGMPISVTLVLSAAPTLNTFTNTATLLCNRGISVTSSAMATIVEPVLPDWFIYLPTVFKNAGPSTSWP